MVTGARGGTVTLAGEASIGFCEGAAEGWVATCAGNGGSGFQVSVISQAGARGCCLCAMRQRKRERCRDRKVQDGDGPHDTAIQP